MSARNLILLLTSSLAGWTLGNGIIPILPVYAMTLGATQAVAGYYLGFCYLWLALGVILAGWLCEPRWQ